MSIHPYKSYDGIITKRYVEPSGTPPSVDPLQEKYDIIAVSTNANIQFTNYLPTRRISRGGRIIPAEVGDPCKIVFNGKEFFVHCFTEGLPFIEACP